jgi:polyphenol oxidase
MSHDPPRLMTTRKGGVSVAPFDSFNLGAHVGDDPLAVLANRHRLAERVGARPVFLNQVHGSHCIQIDAKTPDGLDADGVVTTDPTVACTIMVADCLPILFWSASGSAVGAAHAGWRGLVNTAGTNVLQATVDKLRRLCQPKEPIHAWLGPCIGFESFEVGIEVAQYFEATFTQKIDSEKHWVDLAGSARSQLIALDVSSIQGNDGKPDWCTVRNERDYFSHRRDAKRLGSTGRMAAAIWIHQYQPGSVN